MKLKIAILTIFLALTRIAVSHEAAFVFDLETLSIDSILTSSKYKKVDAMDPGHHKTLIRIHQLREADGYELMFERPICSTVGVLEFTKKQVELAGRNIGEETPLIVISSLGYLPGEKVLLSLRTKDKKHSSTPIEFIPHPIIKKSHSGGFELNAELVTDSPTLFNITLKGFEKNEKFQFSSFSYHEHLSKEHTYSEECTIVYVPGVVGKKGGVAAITVNKKNGDSLELLLPWGSELKKQASGHGFPITRNFNPITYSSLKE